MAETVSNLKCKVFLIGRKSGDCCDSNQMPFNIKRFKMLFKRGFLFYMFFNIRLFIYLIFHKYDILVSNDLDTLLPNYLVAKLKHLPLVYDSHEYFTGVPEIQKRPFVKWVWTTIEKSIFPHLKYVITVSNSIAVQYENEYGIRPVTIRNCSKSSAGITGYTRDELGINKDHLLLIFQGAGINIDRGGEELIKAIHLTENVSLFVIGSGDQLEVMKRSVKELKISERVKFIPKLPREELIKYTKSADAGLSLDKDNNPNYRFSLPNKLFDYLSSGIPVIVSNLPEVSGIVNENDCGLIISKVTPENISAAISEIRDNPERRLEFRRKAEAVSKIISWEIESEKVKKLYTNVLGLMNTE
jgi:glycosyltransferase involved in cell wall biosynthesis